VWALKDINFKVEQGDVVGIIGRNGAGKSTLLKLLSRVTAPTSGIIRAKGRIASLLEVGTGFHPEMTGRENIYMNGAIMGMSRAEITRKLDEIVDFSGCERYLDTPVKRYSSGMTVRLGFAIAAHLEPEILVVDEVLAVGDAEFQKKAIGKMQNVSRGEGRTVLFVSHNMGAVKSLCKTGLLLKDGKIIHQGQVNDVVDYYISNIEDGECITKTIVTPQMRDRNRSLKLEFISLEHIKGNNKYASNENISLKIVIKANSATKDCRINCTIRTLDGQSICNNSSETYFNIEDGQIKTFKYTLINPGLAIGKYTLSFSVGIGNMMTGETNFDVLTNALTIEISKPYKDCNYNYVKWDYGSWGHILMQNTLEELTP
jgi:lipopolysaccharide transport system ATP-binding protein